jgi:hypothetical protein
MLGRGDLGAERRLADLPGTGDKHDPRVPQGFHDDRPDAAREQTRRHTALLGSNGCFLLRKWLIAQA